MSDETKLKMSLSQIKRLKKFPRRISEKTKKKISESTKIRMSNPNEIEKLKISNKKYEDSKTILVNCSFSGYDGFKLGRYHRDAQFYLMNCSFAKNMADTPIYRVPTTNIIQWGHRVYYYNCHRAGGDYSWFANNLQTAKGSPKPEDITIEWLFGNKWNPLQD